jgi:iron complex transport system permease protein
MQITTKKSEHQQDVQPAKRKASRQRLTKRRLLITLAVLSILLILVACVAVSIGSEKIALGSILKIIFARITGATITVPIEQQTIIADVRLPRVLLGAIVGAALAVAGSAYQVLLRNPLADPYILGISTGAALGAIGATVFAENFPIGRTLAAFLGAMLTIAAVYFLGQTQRGASTERLILAGVIINSFLSSGVIFLLTVAAGSRLRSVFSWLIGDLSGDSNLLPVIFIFILTGILIIYLNARSLNLLMMGEEDALAMGVEVRRVQIVVFLAASLITGAAVAVSGVIGFVGLIIPHAVRLTGGSDNRLVIAASALTGACFLLLADMVARTIIAPSELHIGVITALIGAPVFVYLLRRAS